MQLLRLSEPLTSWIKQPVPIRRNDPPLLPVPSNQSVQRFAQACSLRLPTPGVCPFGGVCHLCPARVQAKMSISQPGDAYAQVMRMPEPCAACADEEIAQAKPLEAQITPLVQRQTEPDEEDEPVQAKTHDTQSSSVTSALETQAHSLRGCGQRLPASVRRFFEPRFGTDFSQVRVHTGLQADEIARAANAQALTLGRDIVFSTGKYSPETLSGKRLLAHELTHVTQQSHRIAYGNQAFFVQRYPSTTPHGRPYTAGVMHNHRPSGRWSGIQVIESRNRWSSRISFACSTLPPTLVLSAAMEFELSGYPLAQAHLWHYLGGGGADYTEDVLDFITRDSSLRVKLALHASRSPRGHFKVEQYDYSLDNAGQDFRRAFGAIDRLDYEVERSTGLVHVWFADRYEFHPVYPGFYSALAGDRARETNCVHAAATELKASGAADFWMVGYGIIPLTRITGPISPGSGSNL